MVAASNQYVAFRCLLLFPRLFWFRYDTALPASLHLTPLNGERVTDSACAVCVIFSDELLKFVST